MKRYRVLGMDFDARPNLLNISISDEATPEAKQLMLGNQQSVREGLLIEYGIHDSAMKLQNFRELGAALPSVLTFHNNFMRQIRASFVIGSYYPALTGACALGERILNHLLLNLREFYSSTPEYKRVYDKDSFDDWDIPIETLTAWNILLPDVVANFTKLKKQRHRTLHFDPATDNNDRELALSAIKTLAAIINDQFGALEPKPWFIPANIGIAFIKRECEEAPFIKVVYLPSCRLVGPRHTLDMSPNRWLPRDEYEYEDKMITDEEFIRLFKVAQISRC
jgi:hypothetical protein